MKGMKQIQELKDRLEDLYAAQNALELAIDYVVEAEGYCRDVGIQPSHHADMELAECLVEVEEMIQKIEDSVADI